MMGHKHDEHCEHKPPVELPPVIEVPAPPQEIHQVPINGAVPVLIPLLLCVAWVAIRRRKG